MSSSSTATVGVRILLQESATAGFDALGLSAQRLGYQFAQLGGIWNTLSPTQQLLAQTTIASGIAFAGFAGILGVVFDQGSQLGQALAGVSLAVQGADQNSQSMSDTLIGLANNSLYTSTQVAQGFDTMGEHGQNAQAIIAGDGLALVDMAEAMQTQTVPAAALLSSTLQAFNLDASQAMNTANLLTGAFYNGLPSVDGLRQALTRVAGEAKTLKIPLVDILTTLDILGQSGFTAAQAGTALYNLLKNLTDPTTKAESALASLGIVAVNDTAPALVNLYNQVNNLETKTGHFDLDPTVESLKKVYDGAKKFDLLSTDDSFYTWALKNGFITSGFFDPASGSFLGLKNAIDSIGRSLQGLPPDVQLAKIQDIFNVRGAQGVDLLVQNLAQIDPLWISIQQNLKSTSAPADAQKVTETMGGAFQRLQTTLKDFAGKVGDSLGPTLVPIFDRINNFITNLTLHHKDLLPLIGHWVLLGTAISGIIFAVSGAGLGFSILLRVFRDIQPFVGPLLGIFGQLGGVFGTLAGFGPRLAGAFLNLPPLFGSIGSTASALWGGLSFVFSNLGVIIPALGSWIASLVSGGLSALPALLSGIVPGAISLAGSIAAVAAPILLVIGVIAVIVLLFTKFRAEGMQIVSMFQTAFTPIIHQVASIFMQTMGWIKQAWEQALPKIKPAIDNLVAGFHSAMPVIEFFGRVLGGIIAGIVGLLGGLVVGIINAIGPIINVFAGILKVIGDLGRFVVAIFHGDFKGAFAALEDMVVHIGSVFKNFGLAVWGIVSGIVMGIINFFKHLAEVVVGHSIIPDMVAAILTVFRVFGAVAHTIISAVVEVIVVIFNFLKTAVMVIVNAIVDVFRLWWAYLQFLIAIVRAVFILPLVAGFSLIWLGIQAGISLATGNWDNFKNALLTVYNFIKQNVIDPVVKAFQSIWDCIQNGISGALGFWDMLKQKVLDFYNATIGKLQGLLDTLGKIMSGLGDNGGTGSPHGGGHAGGMGPGAHATGYITNGPEFALIGEGGEREIVAPVSKLIAAAQMAVGANGSNGTIIVPLYVDGRQIAKAQFDMTGRMLRSAGFGRRFR